VTTYKAPQGQVFTVATDDAARHMVIGVQRPIDPRFVYGGFTGSKVTFGCYRFKKSDPIKCDGLKQSPETFTFLQRDYLGLLIDPGVLAIASTPGAAVRVRPKGRGVPDVCLEGEATGGQRRLCVSESGAVTEVVFGDRQIVITAIRGARAADLDKPK